MNESARSMDVLSKLLKMRPQEGLIKEYFLSKEDAELVKKKPGRPRKENHLKAKNFTLCLDPKFLAFIDRFQIPGKRISGRGRKIRYIIEQFIEMHKRQGDQIKVLIEGLDHVSTVLQNFSGKVKKGEKLDLNSREKAEITKAVNQIKILLKVLNYRPKEMQRILSREKWATLSFCLNWGQKYG